MTAGASKSAIEDNLSLIDTGDGRPLGQTAQSLQVKGKESEQNIKDMQKEWASNYPWVF